MSKHVFVVLSNPTAGLEAEYNDWYTNRHLHDVVRIPGMAAAQRFALSAAQREAPPYPFQYLALYDVDAPSLADTIGNLVRTSGSPAMPLSDSLGPNRGTWMYDPITPKISGPNPPPKGGSVQKHVLLALTNPKEGREDDYNDWHTNRHVHDVLRIPGIAAAQRYKLSSSQRANPPYPYQYMALYDIETADLAKTVDALRQASGTPALAPSEALGEQHAAWIFHAITPKVHAKA